MTNYPERPKALDRPLVRPEPGGNKIVDVNDALKKVKQAVEGAIPKEDTK